MGPGSDRWIERAAWLALALAPAAMVVGHLGAPGLDWRAHHVSTYAARAPGDDWITAAMLLSAVAMMCIGVLVSGAGRPGGRIAAGLIAMALGASVSGLLLLAGFEETATGMAALRSAGFDAIRRQSFHDAGLFVFFHGTILALLGAGVALLAGRGLRRRLFGAAVAASGPLAYAAMATTWPTLLGIAGAGVGLKQRLSFLFLWVGAVLLLAAIAARRRAT